MNLIDYDEQEDHQDLGAQMYFEQPKPQNTGTKKIAVLACPKV